MNIVTANSHETPSASTRRTPSPNTQVTLPVTENERFPSLDVSRSNENRYPVASPVEFTPTQAVTEKHKWPARRSSQRGRENGRVPGLHSHRTRRSVSDAINNFRVRRGSVSENAQELAEALKAPVSYRLIVSCLKHMDFITPANTCVGSLCGLVHDFCSDQHLIEINLDCLSKTGHLDNTSIRICLYLVPHPRIPRIGLPQSQEINTSAQKWHHAAFKGSDVYCVAALGVPAPRPSVELVCDAKDTGLTRSHDQRSIPAVHRARISSILSHSLRTSHLSIAGPFDCRSDDGLLNGFLYQFLGH